MFSRELHVLSTFYEVLCDCAQDLPTGAIIGVRIKGKVLVASPPPPWESPNPLSLLLPAVLEMALPRPGTMMHGLGT
jgi:hypothetical protein